ncbi:cephalosporin hydroxylase family protein [Rhizobium sp. Rhizsp42]|uniref:cephalosporin hydroxylase family protein n=1 Tax=Rhizobium sp. Rhizsp42 TaxID=3243034 RepID=UPI0039B067CA
MDPISQFQNERSATIKSYHDDAEFNRLSQQWLQESMAKRYVYNFDWLGRPIIQYPQDMAAVQEVIWATRPDVVVETGIAHGGSLIFSASVLAMLDYADAVESGTVLDPMRPSRRVVGVDIDIRSHNLDAIKRHPMSSRITMIQGSSTADETVNQVRDAVGDAKRVMVCLDSMHTHDHVLTELEYYAPMVTPGCYCIVFDTFVEDMPKDFFADRPWNVGDNPKTAVHEWLAGNANFEIDRDMASKLQVTVAPDGFLRRVK